MAAKPRFFRRLPERDEDELDLRRLEEDLPEEDDLERLEEEPEDLPEREDLLELRLPEDEEEDLDRPDEDRLEEDLPDEDEVLPEDGAGVESASIWVFSCFSSFLLSAKANHPFHLF